ncbi:DESI1, partial [Symbiodinium sp. CCMP2456]
LVIPLGSTLRQRDELHAFIVDELKPIFNREAYDAARNNCNHFTDRVSMYLAWR